MGFFFFSSSSSSSSSSSLFFSLLLSSFCWRACVCMCLVLLVPLLSSARPAETLVVACLPAETGRVRETYDALCSP